MRCPKCESEEKQHKIGKTVAGSQRYRCYLCGCKYTPAKKPRGYSFEIRQKAIQLYVDGMNLRRIGRQLKVNPQSVANWIKAHAEILPPAPVPEEIENAELDELFTFIGEKKTESTSLRAWIEPHAVSWAGRLSGNAAAKTFKQWWMGARKPSGISVMLSRRTPRSGFILVATKSRKANPKLIQSKQITPNYAITSLDSLEPLGVSHVARMPCTALFACSSTATTIANSNVASSQITRLISATSLTH